MKPQTLLISAIAALLCPSAVLAQATARDPNAATDSFKCVKRATDLQPPRVSLPSLRAFGGKEQKSPSPRKLRPACPEGQVPVTTAPSERRFPKGNPLIGSYAEAGPERPLSGEFIRKNLLLPFDQVYWKREGKSAQPRPKPMNGAGDPPCNGVAWFGSCFYYASSAERRVADGGGMTFTVEAPTVDNSGDAGGHSVAEIAVQGGPSDGDDVEMGWSVSPDQFGDNKPHLFIYHWINWGQTCYNTCGWNQYSNAYFPGMDLTPLVGQNVYIGWVHFRSAWWGWFNDQWLGYVKDSEWSGAFTQTTLIQWYGEVASNNGIPPKTQMGNGQFPSQTTAASMATLCDVDARAWVCFYRDLQSAGATRINYYDILNHTSFGAVRYGGPGQ